MSNITLKDPKSNAVFVFTLVDALKELDKTMQKKQAFKALNYAQQITEQAPNCLPAYVAIYKILSFQQQFLVLEKIALSAINQNPKHGESYYALSNAYRFQRKTNNALQAMEKAVELAPEKNPWLDALGIMHKELGHFEIAIQLFEQCIKQAPNFSQAYWHRSDIKTKMPNEYVDHLTTLVSVDSNAAVKEQVYAAYALFKHFEAMASFEKAFTYLELGATKQRGLFNYDHQAELNEHKNIELVFNKQFLNKQWLNKNEVALTKSVLGKTKNKADDSPIFICGLPRSGTTLTEQIISSHSEVSAGDELFELAQATQNILQQVQPKQAFPFLANELTKQHWQKIGEEYLTLTQHVNTKRYFTDKMPLNYKAIGLIHMALPSAKIVYCQRPPMDLLLGAYKQILSSGNHYSYDLDELTDMIIAQHYLMQHWFKVLPEKIFILDYKKLVTDQEATTRDLLNFLGLEWQQGCIDFHKNTRVVHTVSNAQIRKPLFNSSINAWLKYSEQLKPYAEKMKKAGLLL